MSQITPAGLGKLSSELAPFRTKELYDGVVERMYVDRVVRLCRRVP